MRVSLLKFEPRVSTFPVTESGEPVSVTTVTGKVLARVSVMFVTFLNFLYVLDVGINSNHDFAILHAITKSTSKSYKKSSKIFYVVKVRDPQRLLVTTQTKGVFLS